MKNLMELPKELPIPQDDGACDHLIGMPFPSVKLRTTQDRIIDFGRYKKPCVIFFYPRTGEPDKPTPDTWDMIPGARGCTPQSCGYRDLHTEFKELGFEVFGASSQTTDYQKEFVNRMHIPFEILSDENYDLINSLKLPTFEFNQNRLVKRLAIVVENKKISKVFYPVFPPNENAQTVLTWLEGRSKINKIIHKAVAYITRNLGPETELLVFDHDKEYSEAGTQVIAGTVDEGEKPENTILRECFEEGGLSELTIKSKIDDYVFYRDTHNQYNRRHIYHLETQKTLPDRWTHHIKSDGEDNGHNFHFFWIKLSEAEGKLSGQLDRSISKLKNLIELSQHISFATIKLPETQDLCVKMRADSFQESFGNTDRFYQDDGEKKYLEWLKAKIDRNPRSAVHVLFKNEIIGQIELGKLKTDPSVGYVNLYYLLPQYRGQGFSALLDNYVTNFLKSEGHSLAQLAVSPTNKRAIRFYENHGWINKGPRENSPEVHAMQKML